MTVLLVGLGGGTGAAARYLVDLLATRMFGLAFPVGTMAVNVIGSFLMGVLVVWLAKRGEASDAMRLMLGTGFLGGFTTFSTFSLNAVTLWEREAYSLATLYVAGSVVLGVAALLAGLAIGRNVL